MSADASSTDTPPQSSFADLQLQPATLAALDALGWSRPTPVQVAAYAPSIAGHDLIVQAPTGTGKTGAFAMPLVDRLLTPKGQVQALILAPTRELALQSARECTALGEGHGLKVAAVYGGVDIDKQLRTLAHGVDIISGTPGRVLDHLRRGSFDPKDLRVLVLDEADEILSMGFAREMQAIIALLPQTRQTLLYSATVDDEVQRVASRYMREPRFLTTAHPADRPGGNIAHFYYMVPSGRRGHALVSVLRSEAPDSAIIFCNTKIETVQVAETLNRAGLRAAHLSSDLNQAERETILGAMRRGTLPFLVATDVAARGVDISHITHVINFNFPAGAEQYVHRTGRTGRAGRSGVAISLVSAQELGALYYLRLQYAIDPIEKSLPNARDRQTRDESARVESLAAAALAAPPPTSDLALAQRILTHPDALPIIARLVQAQPAGADAAPSDPRPRGTAAPILQGRAAPHSQRNAVPRKQPRATPAHELRSTQDPAPSVPQRTPRSRRAAPEAQPDGGSRRLRPRAGRIEPDATASADPTEGVMTTLRLSIGRRDGLRAGELSRWLRETETVSRAELGRIRVRDDHALVMVEPGAVDALEQALTTKDWQDQAVSVTRLAARQVAASTSTDDVAATAASAEAVGEG
ncbi:MAG: DEAD/DEAH box helicase [Polyangiales bacterium]